MRQIDYTIGSWRGGQEGDIVVPLPVELIVLPRFQQMPQMIVNGVRNRIEHMGAVFNSFALVKGFISDRRECDEHVFVSPEFFEAEIYSLVLSFDLRGENHNHRVERCVSWVRRVQ